MISSTDAPRPALTPLIELYDVTKSYGPDPVLGPVSLTVHAGEVIGLCGKNGAGKTTLISILAGTLQPDGGRIRRDPSLHRAVGFVPQEIALYPTLSGRDNLRFWADAYGLPARAAKARVNWLLGLMQLTDKGRSRVETYSGGMKRRLNLASAIVITPRMLLLDEPTVGADAASTEIILSVIRQLRHNGCGVVLITHQYEQLSAVSDRILTLEAGRFVPAETV